jgi:hypothetical protein
MMRSGRKKHKGRGSRNKVIKEEKPMGPGRQDFLHCPGPAFQRFAETRSHHNVMIRKGLGVSQQAISAEAEMRSRGQSWPREHCLPVSEVTNILSKRKR